MSYNLSPLLKQRFLDSNGLPLAGGLLYSYLAGTTTPQDTYSNSSGTVNTNPVVLDANGYADVWMDPTGAYKFILTDSDGNTIFTVDHVTSPFEVSTWSANVTYSQGDIVQDSSGYGLFYVSLTNNNLNHALSAVNYWRVLGGNIRTVSTDTTLLVTDEFVRSNSTGGNVTLTLPACATTPIGKRITAKDVGTGGYSTSVKGSGSDNVDTSNTWSTSLSAQTSMTFENNGVSWDALRTVIVDGEVTTAKIADGAITQAKRASLGQQISSASGIVDISSQTFVDVTNMSVSITTTGRPVYITLIADPSASDSSMVEGAVSGGSYFKLLRGASTVGIIGALLDNNPPGSINFIDTPAAGTYTYKLQASNANSGQHSFVYKCKLLAYEL